jgi:hypothetical protein
MRILKKSICPGISPKAEASITYNVGYDPTTKTFSVRVIANSGGGFFSNEWIKVDDVLSCIQATDSSEPFKALIFQRLYMSRGANNHGFLGAALRSEGVLKPVAKAVYSHELDSPKTFNAAMQKLLKSKVDLKDEVAIREAEMEAKREKLLAQMKSKNKK